MYLNLIRDRNNLYDLLRPGKDPALYHCGNYGRVLNYHRRHADRVAVNPSSLPPVAPYLWDRMARPESLRCALDALVQDGPKSPGRDDVRLEEMSDREKWDMCRCLHQDLKDGSYHPGPVLHRPIPKAGRPGETRVITLLCARDRVVAKALALFVGPIVDPAFSPFSFGFRPKVSPATALASAIALATRTDRWVWVTADLDHAFDRIPAQPAIDACRRFVTEEVAQFIRLISFRNQEKGTPQGSPWSPLLFNIFADRYLDRPWHRRDKHPLFRFVDDLFTMASSVEEGGQLLDKVRGLARSAGMPLKDAKTAVADLEAGSRVIWLGYSLAGVRSNLSVRVTDRAWDNLGLNLEKCHMHDAASLLAVEVVRGWLEYLGPCYEHEEVPAVLKRVKKIAATRAFDELPEIDRLNQIWSDAHGRWEAVRLAEMASLDRRLGRLAAYRATKAPVVSLQGHDEQELVEG